MLFNLKKLLSISFIFSICYLLFAIPTKAFCPVCTVAVGAGVGLSRWLGIDDTITGLWIGGLTASLIAWTINWLNKKNKTFPYQKPIITFLYCAFMVLPLAWTDIIGHPANRLWGIDKLLLGMILGSIFFLAGGIFYQKIKIRNGGHAHFPFEKVVMPIAPLVVLSLIFYLITK